MAGFSVSAAAVDGAGHQRRLSEQLVHARAALAEALEEAGRLGVEADCEIAEGDPVDELIRAA